MDRWVGRVALVTGASAGIGAAIAKRLVEHGMIVVGCARNIKSIETMAEELTNSNGSLHALRCDVSKEEEILAMFAQIKSKHGGADVCINNAGVNFADGSIMYGSTEHWREMIEVNVMGMAICTREVIKSMRERNVDDGHIIQMDSIFGMTYSHVAFGHWYTATKWMVRAMTDCLRMELRAEKSRIKASAIYPGPVKSEMAARAIGEEVATAYYKVQETLSVDNIADTVVTILGTAEGVEIEDLVIMPTPGWNLNAL